MQLVWKYKYSYNPRVMMMMRMMMIIYANCMLGSCCTNSIAQIKLLCSPTTFLLSSPQWRHLPYSDRGFYFLLKGVCYHPSYHYYFHIVQFVAAEIFFRIWNMKITRWPSLGTLIVESVVTKIYSKYFYCLICRLTLWILFE
jgi:hypothetical protein